MFISISFIKSDLFLSSDFRLSISDKLSIMFDWFDNCLATDMYGKYIFTKLNWNKIKTELIFACSIIKLPFYYYFLIKKNVPSWCSKPLIVPNFGFCFCAAPTLEITFSVILSIEMQWSGANFRTLENDFAKVELSNAAAGLGILKNSFSVV